jgi:hypothetical protein
MASSAVGCPGNGGGSVYRSLSDGWCVSRPRAIIGWTFASRQASTLSSLAYPVSAINVLTRPNALGKPFSCSSIGTICCLSLVAWLSAGATTSKLSVSTAAWAL